MRREDPLSFIEGTYVSESMRSEQAVQEGIRAGVAPTDGESDRVHWWVVRANHYVSMGEYARAEEMLSIANSLQPWSTDVAYVRLRLANLSGDGELRRHAESELCAMGFNTC